MCLVTELRLASHSCEWSRFYPRMAASLRHVVWWKFTDVSEVLAASISGKLLPKYTVQQSKGQPYLYLSLWEPEISGFIICVYLEWLLLILKWFYFRLSRSFRWVVYCQISLGVDFTLHFKVLTRNELVISGSVVTRLRVERSEFDPRGQNNGSNFLSSPLCPDRLWCPSSLSGGFRGSSSAMNLAWCSPFISLCWG
jgi:hypothetical protein